MIEKLKNLLRRRTSILLIPLLSILFCWPLFKRMNALGIGDWDYHFYLNEVFMKSLTHFHQMPLWDPWRCGGIPLFQHYELPFLSPIYFFSILFSTPVAMKINIVFHYLIALLGMVLIGKRLFDIKNFLFVLLASSIFVFNGFLSLQVTIGHLWILPICYIPFIFYFFERWSSSRRVSCLLLCSVFISLMLFDSGFYPLSFLIIFLVLFSVAMDVMSRDFKYSRALLWVGFYSFLFSAIKLIPSLDYFLEHPRPLDSPELVPITALYDIFISRRQLADLVHFSSQSYPWYEYGCYLGFILIGVSLFAVFHGCIRRDKRILALNFCLLIFFLLFLGDAFPYSPYSFLRHLPVYSSQHISSRFVILITFILSLIVFSFSKFIEDGFKLKKANTKLRVLRLLIAFGAFLAITDLFLVNSETFKDAFILNENKIENFYPERTLEATKGLLDMPYQKSLASNSFLFRIENDRAQLSRFLPVFSTEFSAFQLNRSVVECYEATRPARGFEIDQNLIFSSDPSAKIEAIHFTPNRISFSLETEKPVDVFLNQNFVRGWKTHFLNDQEGSVYEYKNKPALHIPAGKYGELDFYYFPDSLLWGLLLFLAGIFAMSVHFIIDRKRRASI